MLDTLAQNHDSIQVVHRILDALNAHNLESLVSYCDPDFVGEDVGQSGRLVGLSAVTDTFHRITTGFPDAHFTAEDVVCMGNKAAVFWRVRGTHRGTVMNIPPTHKKIEFRGTSLFTLQGGKVCKAVHVWDVAAMLREMGLLPELP